MWSGLDEGVVEVLVISGSSTLSLDELTSILVELVACGMLDRVSIMAVLPEYDTSICDEVSKELEFCGLWVALG